MGHFDIQQVCLNGHQTTSSYNRSPQWRRKYCEECGASTIHVCPKCQQGIPGKYDAEGVIAIGFETPVPTHCANCGTAFPWTEKKMLLSAQVSGEAPLDYFQLVEQVCSRFHLIARQLRTRHGERQTLSIEDEYDVQDLLHALLHIYFDDIRPEEWTPSYAGGCSRVDFLLKEEEIVVEVKKTRKSLKAKDVGQELIIDAERYRRHPNCKKLLCFVYDPDGWIANPRGLENDLRKSQDNFEVRVLIVPKGH